MGLREDIWDELSIREALQMARRNQVFVELTFRNGEDGELVIPFNWIEFVGSGYFEFKPSLIELYRAPISKVVRVVPKTKEGW